MGSLHQFAVVVPMKLYIIDAHLEEKRAHIQNAANNYQSVRDPMIIENRTRRFFMTVFLFSSSVICLVFETRMKPFPLHQGKLLTCDTACML